MGFASAVILDRECFGEGVGIGVRKEDRELRELLNKAIAEVRADGTYQTIEKNISHTISTASDQDSGGWGTPRDAL